MQLNPYLEFNNQCAAAFKFYESALNGKINMMLSHADSPMADQVPADWRNAILHASMTIGNQTLLGSDRPPQHYKPPQGFFVSLTLPNPAESERVFNALAENGQIRMPLQKTFWSASFGMLVDQFGIPWMINCEQAA